MQKKIDKLEKRGEIDAFNAYFYRRELVGESTVELVLFRDILDEAMLIKAIADACKEVDGVGFDHGRKFRKGKIDRLMFISYIDCEEEDVILKTYNKCVNGKNYPKIPDLQQNMKKYVKKLKFVYRGYRRKIIPMLVDKMTYSTAEYDSRIREIFGSLD